MTKKTICACRECRTALTRPEDAGKRPNPSRPPALFCSMTCRTTWNNRRKTRGADLYDLWMAMRYARDDAKVLGVWKEMCRLSETWNAEDKAAGRETFERPKKVLDRLMDSGRLPRARGAAI